MKGQKGISYGLKGAKYHQKGYSKGQKGGSYDLRGVKYR